MQFRSLICAWLLFYMSPGNASDGSELLAQCTVTLNAADRSFSGDVSSRGALDSTRCISLISGISQASTLYKASGLMARPMICSPRLGITTDQAVRIVVKYLKANPEMLHLRSSILVLDALAAAFPCGGTAK